MPSCLPPAPAPAAPAPSPSRPASSSAPATGHAPQDGLHLLGAREHVPELAALALAAADGEVEEGAHLNAPAPAAATVKGSPAFVAAVKWPVLTPATAATVVFKGPVLPPAAVAAIKRPVLTPTATVAIVKGPVLTPAPAPSIAAIKGPALTSASATSDAVIKGPVPAPTAVVAFKGPVLTPASVVALPGMLSLHVPTHEGRALTLPTAAAPTAHERGALPAAAAATAHEWGTLTLPAAVAPTHAPMLLLIELRGATATATRRRRRWRLPRGTEGRSATSIATSLPPAAAAAVAPVPPASAPFPPTAAAVGALRSTTPVPAATP